MNRLLEEATGLRERVLLAEERLKARLVGGSSANPYPTGGANGGDNDGVVVDWALAGGLVGVRDGSDADADADVAPLAPCVIERLVISRRGELTCPVRCGWVFGGGLQPATVRLSSAHDIVGLLRLSLARVDAQFKHVLGLDMVLNWAKNGGLSPVERVHLFVVREVDGVHEGNVFVEFVRGDDRDDERVWEPVGFFIFGTSWVLGGHQPPDKCTFRDVPPERIVVAAYDELGRTTAGETPARASAAPGPSTRPPRRSSRPGSATPRKGASSPKGRPREASRGRRKGEGGGEELESAGSLRPRPRSRSHLRFRSRPRSRPAARRHPRASRRRHMRSWRAGPWPEGSQGSGRKRRGLAREAEAAAARRGGPLPRGPRRALSRRLRA